MASQAIHQQQPAKACHSVESEIPTVSTMKAKNVSLYADRHIKNVAQKEGTVLSSDQRAKITSELQEYIYSQGHVEPKNVMVYLTKLVLKSLRADKQGTQAAVEVEDDVMADVVVAEKKA